MEMNHNEAAEFLREFPFAVFCTLRKDGAPFPLPLAHNFRGESFGPGDHLYINTAEGRMLVGRLARDPRISFCVSNGTFPSKSVIGEGVAERIEDPDDSIARSMVRANMDSREGVDLDKFERQWLEVPRVIFRIRVDRVVSWDSTKKGDDNELAWMTITEYNRLKKSGAIEGTPGTSANST